MAPQNGIQYGPFPLPQNGLPIKLTLKTWSFYHYIDRQIDTSFQLYRKKKTMGRNKIQENSYFIPFIKIQEGIDPTGQNRKKISGVVQQEREKEERERGK